MDLIPALVFAVLTTGAFVLVVSCIVIKYEDRINYWLAQYKAWIRSMVQ
jgi:hypothetical protein